MDKATVLFEQRGTHPTRRTPTQVGRAPGGDPVNLVGSNKPGRLSSDLPNRLRKENDPRPHSSSERSRAGDEWGDTQCQVPRTVATSSVGDLPRLRPASHEFSSVLVLDAYAGLSRPLGRGTMSKGEGRVTRHPVSAACDHPSPPAFSCASACFAGQAPRLSSPLEFVTTTWLVCSAAPSGRGADAVCTLHLAHCTLHPINDPRVTQLKQYRTPSNVIR